MDLQDEGSASEGVNWLELLKNHTITRREVLVYIDTYLNSKIKLPIFPCQKTDEVDDLE